MKKIKKIFAWSLKHRIAASFLVIAVLGVGYWGYSKISGGDMTLQYVSAAAEKGTIVVSISGTGQVSASNQVDLKPKVSGDVVYVGVKAGQEVKAGTLLVQIDPQETQKAVRDAEANLESAKISLQKLLEPADNLSLIQAENALAQANESKQNSENDLVKAYDDGFNAIANAFIDLPGVVTGLDDILNNNNVNLTQDNAYAYAHLISNYRTDAEQFRDLALEGYKKARVEFEKNLGDYKSASRYSDKKIIENLISETYESVKTISEEIKNTKSFLDLVNDTLSTQAYVINPPAILSTHEGNLQDYTATTNSHLGNLLNIRNTIENNQDAIISAERTISEKTESLANLKMGAEELDIKSAQLSVIQRENALLDAKEKLADYYIRAPFSGTVAKVDVKKLDSISSGSTVVTMVTKQQLAEISLNEVDVAKVKNGQKSTLSFDAVEDLNITGEVAEVDTIGTVSQGVVAYNVKISFDTQDDRIKPGMSVSAEIITDVKQDVLTVPNSAVKTQNGVSYVEVMESISKGSSSASGISGMPVQKLVEVGISNDTLIEIVSGLNEGEAVVTRTVNLGGQAATQQPTSILGAGNQTRGAGGVIGIPR